MSFKNKKVLMLVNVVICVEKDENGFYAYSFPFKGLRACGSTLEETLKNARNAIAAYIGSLLKHCEPIPCCTIEREKLNKDCKIYSEVIEILEVD